MRYAGVVANLTGNPAMSVPLYWNEDGLPIGVHFLGRFGDEATLLRLAAQLEAAQPLGEATLPRRARRAFAGRRLSPQDAKAGGQPSREDSQAPGGRVANGKTGAMTRWVLHVDLDQFLAAVEVLRHPELRGKPVVVGGDGDPTKRGVVSTASYEAREAGVHSGLPLRTAAKRCPDCVFLPVDADAYNEVSAVVMDVLRETGCPVEVLGWDEAFVGVELPETRLIPESFARGLAADVKAATQLDCSVGIGQNKLQAKIATAFGKPAGVSRLTSATWFDVLGDRPPDAIWGIGAKTVAKLAALGITTVRELAGADPDALAAVFGPMTGPWLVLIGRGRGDADRRPDPVRAPLAWPRGHLPAQHQGLGSGPDRDRSASPPGQRRSHRPPRCPRRRQGPLRPVHHRDPRRGLAGPDPDASPRPPWTPCPASRPTARSGCSASAPSSPARNDHRVVGGRSRFRTAARETDGAACSSQSSGVRPRLSRACGSAP